MEQFFRFTIQLILYIIQWVLNPIIEFLTFIVVLFTPRMQTLTFFDNKGLNADIRSSSDHRAFWNLLLVRKGGYRFIKNTDKSISNYIGINSLKKTLTIFGWVLYYFLYMIDFSAWKNGGHCLDAYNNYLKQNK